MTGGWRVNPSDGWYTQTPEEFGYTAPRDGVAAGAKLKRDPGSEGAWVYKTGMAQMATWRMATVRHDIALDL